MDPEVRLPRRDVFLERKLDTVCNRLQKPERTNPVRAKSRLHPAEDLAFGQCHVRKREQEPVHDDERLDQCGYDGQDDVPGRAVEAK